MKQPGLVIIVAVMMLSACGKKSGEQPPPVESPMPSSQQDTAVVAEQDRTIPAGEKVREVMTQAPPVMEKPPASAEPAMEHDAAAGAPLSHDRGLALAKKSGCLACHKIEAKLVGPAWRDVSERYKGDPDAKARLLAKVKAGGKGNWTEVTGGISMPPYSPRVSDEDIEKLVTFVLSQ